ncbi:hypothetical protein ANN_05625 [Periplaneta americana]|uniref:Uncharacterized protein n=1 Tax=Periplaneta americana TaxID=6978 RepID=A0ABQ8TD48_PERAM|nr:hypothetical protein ANN_05625 [Periplaneta americana]
MAGLCEGGNEPPGSLKARVGIVLITVSGVAWRLTAHDAPSCRMMLGLGGGDEGGAEPNRRFVPRLPPSYGRPHHPYAAMMYPEFQYRPPPPSYQASMQEYRLRLLLLDRHPGTVAPGQAPGGHAVSPPPTYRSHAGSTLRYSSDFIAPKISFQNKTRKGPARGEAGAAPLGLQPPAQLQVQDEFDAAHAGPERQHRVFHGGAQPRPFPKSERVRGGSAVVNVISVMGSEPEPLDTVKLAGLPADQDVPLRMMLNKSGCHSSAMESEGKDGNLVTIVQTGDDSSPVIVTVSGSTTVGGSTSQQPGGNGIVDTEMEILAHL